MSLDELQQATGLDVSKLPEDVREFDRKQNPQNYKSSNSSSPDVVDEKSLPESTQPLKTSVKEPSNYIKLPTNLC
uniref:Uncharacterized protein n=1 Tax=Megaselia scalaris TaxID=36166 RepID=T1GV50_MEGSC